MPMNATFRFADTHGIDMEFAPGQMSVVHKPSYMKDYQAHPAFMAERTDLASAKNSAVNLWIS